VLRRVAEEIVGMAHDELIERRRRGYQNGARASAAASSASGALPGGGDGAGISGHDDGIEGATSMPEFERAGGNDAADFSIAQSRSISRARLAGSRRGSREWFSGFPGSWDCLLQIGEENFGVQARVREHHGLQIVLQEFLSYARGFIDVLGECRARDLRRRIVENESLLRGGRAVRIEDFDFGFKKA